MSVNLATRNKSTVKCVIYRPGGMSPANITLSAQNINNILCLVLKWHILVHYVNVKILPALTIFSNLHSSQQIAMMRGRVSHVSPATQQRQQLKKIQNDNKSNYKSHSGDFALTHGSVVLLLSFPMTQPASGLQVTLNSLSHHLTLKHCKKRDL